MGLLPTGTEIRVTGQTRPLGYGATPLVLQACELGCLATYLVLRTYTGQVLRIYIATGTDIYTESAVGNKKEIHENYLEQFFTSFSPHTQNPAPLIGISPKFGTPKNGKRVINSRTSLCSIHPNESSGLCVHGLCKYS
jgi:hypothetical protein